TCCPILNCQSISSRGGAIIKRIPALEPQRKERSFDARYAVFRYLLLSPLSSYLNLLLCQHFILPCRINTFRINNSPQFHMALAVNGEQCTVEEHYILVTGGGRLRY